MSTELETWEAYVKTLPEEVRVGLAEYAAKSFLEGVEKGKKLGQEGAVLFIRQNARIKTNDDASYEYTISSVGLEDLLSAASKQGV